MRILSSFFLEIKFGDFFGEESLGLPHKEEAEERS